MAFKDSAKAFATKFRLDSHHAIERFGIVSGVLGVSFILIFGGASISAVMNQTEQLSNTALYTPSFTTSKTQLGGDVSGVYVNEDRTRSMVLMKFSSPDSVSANARNYQSFLTGSNRNLAEEALKSEVTGEVVVFGSTGYLAAVLESKQPFAQQILNLTLRANSELVYKPGETGKVRKDLQGQDSFIENDQWRVYVNPGAGEAEVSELLNGAEFDPGAVYAELIVKPQEDEIRKKLDDQLGQMRADLARIAEYEADMRRVNVDGTFLVPPAKLEQISGDEVIGDVATDKKESTLELRTEWVSPSGFDFDWRDGSVREGYLDSLVPEGESYVTFLADKAAMSRERTGVSQLVNSMEWKLSNDRFLDDYSSSDTAMKPLFDIRNGLAQAYQDYYSHKIDYQVKGYGELIDLEVELRNVRSGASVNDTADALFTY